jgi:CubicO group peptidase (beta-lactamase class C family)
MKKYFYRSVAILFLVSVITWIFLPSYLRNALIYQHPDIDDYKIFQNRVVEKGIPCPWNLHKDYNKARLSESALKYIERYKTVAFLVLKNDSILHEEYWDGYTDSTSSGSFSVAKSIVSMLIGCLLDEGKIKSLDQPMTDFVSEFQDPGLKKISIRDLLTMSSGLGWDESYSSATSITTQAYYGNEITKLVTSLKPVELPGRVFRYKSCDSQILSLIVERSSGKHLAEYASEKLWKPLGAEHSALWSLDHKDGDEKAYCCFNSNARDFARIGQMLLDSGQFNGKQILSKEYIRQATSPATWLKDERGATCDWYGYQIWMLNYKGVKINYARGILGQYIFMIPEKKMVIVRLGHKRSELKRGILPDDIYKYLDAAFSL